MRKQYKFCSCGDRSCTERAQEGGKGSGPSETVLRNHSPRAQNNLQNMKNKLQACVSLSKLTSYRAKGPCKLLQQDYV